MKAFRLLLGLLAVMLLSGGASVAAGVADYTPHPLGLSYKSQADQLAQKGDHAAAAQMLERWLEADPRDFNSWYTMARLQALLGKKENALDAFERAIDSGWPDSALPLNDTYLESIRTASRFVAALDRIKTTLPKDPVGFLERVAPMRSQGAYIVMLPPDYDSNKRDYPLCVILHGSGSNERAHGELADHIGRYGVIYVAIRAPYPDFRAAAGTRNPGYSAWPPERNVPDDAVRTQYVDWIVDVVADMRKEFRVRPGKVFLWGHSQGGSFAILTTLLHPDLIGGYFSLAGAGVPDKWFTDASLETMKRDKVAAWLVHGATDPAVPAATSERLQERLEKAGVQVRHEVVQGGHGITDELIRLARQWLKQVVLKGG